MLSNALIAATVATNDLSRARSFYRDRLGLTETGPPEGGMYFRAGAATLLHLYERPGAPAEQTAATFLVENIKEVMAGLRANGIAFEEYNSPELTTVNALFVHPDHGFKVSWFKDSDGNTLSLEQGTVALGAN